MNSAKKRREYGNQRCYGGAPGSHAVHFIDGGKLDLLQVWLYQFRKLAVEITADQMSFSDHINFLFQNGLLKRPFVQRSVKQYNFETGYGLIQVLFEDEVC